MANSPGSAPVAFVTGASRGIGRACATALATHGHDVAVAARTLVDGTATLDDDEAGVTTVVPGGLDTTVAAIETHGQQGYAVAMDVLDRQSVLAAADAVIEHFGRIDVLVNNAIYQGPGSMTPLLELDDAEIERLFEGNVLAQLALIRHLLPRFVDQGGATIINMISGTAHLTPPGPIGRGGWGVAYAMTKGALERVAPVLNVEHGADGLVVHSVDPGYVRTERAEAKAAARGDRSGHTDHFTPATPDVIGAAVAWLVTDPAGAEQAGQIVHAQRVALQQQLVPDWRS
ncbi:MAG: SDR family oxidoreductase [Acidimicrobiia bacterium]|nr:SDR family oxidoreductase [Acidimicrobiia bacterium]